MLGYDLACFFNRSRFFHQFGNELMVMSFQLVDGLLGSAAITPGYMLAYFNQGIGGARQGRQHYNSWLFFLGNQ